MKPCPKPEKAPKEKRKKTPSERVRLERENDRMVSLIVIKRDGGCVTPGGCSGNLTCSHYYNRRKKLLRWDLANCNCQCSGHNLRHNYNPQYYTSYMIAAYGLRLFSELTELAKIDGHKWSVPELREINANLRAVYRGLFGKDYE